MRQNIVKRFILVKRSYCCLLLGNNQIQLWYFCGLFAINKWIHLFIPFSVSINRAETTKKSFSSDKIQNQTKRILLPLSQLCVSASDAHGVPFPWDTWKYPRRRRRRRWCHAYALFFPSTSSHKLWRLSWYRHSSFSTVSFDLWETVLKENRVIGGVI